jgi:hypothetical protein
VIDGRRRDEAWKLLRGIRQHKDRCARRFPFQERRRLIEPDEVDLASTRPLQAHLKIEFRREGQIGIARDDPDIDVTVAAQRAARARTKEEGQT